MPEPELIDQLRAAEKERDSLAEQLRVAMEERGQARLLVGLAALGGVGPEQTIGEWKQRANDLLAAEQQLRKARELCDWAHTNMEGADEPAFSIYAHVWGVLAALAQPSAPTVERKES